MILCRNKCVEKIWKTKAMVVAVICLLVALIHFVYIYVINNQIIEVETGTMTWNNTYLVQLNSHISVSLCIPAIASDMKLNLPRLLSSVNIQTYIPMEVVIVMSNTKTMECNTFKQRLTAFYNASVLNLYCVSKLQYQSISRQNASSFAKGDVISFIDADDFMFPNRIEVLTAIFYKYRPFMVLHGFSNKANPSWDNNWKQARIYEGIKLFDIEKSTRPHHAWLLAEIMLSQVSVLREVCRKVKFRTGKTFYRSEDAWFVRDVITTFGRHNNTAYFINFPLSWHVPREFQVTKQFLQMPRYFQVTKPSRK